MTSDEDFIKLCRGVMELVKERKVALEERRSENFCVLVYIVMLKGKSFIFNGKRGGDVSQMEVVDYARAIKVKTRGGLLLQEPVFTREGVCQVAPSHLHQRKIRPNSFFH
jgi:hypothetical protein